MLVNMAFVTGFWVGLDLCNKGEVNPGNVLTCLYAFLQASVSANAIFPKILVLTKGCRLGKPPRDKLAISRRKMIIRVNHVGLHFGRRRDVRGMWIPRMSHSPIHQMPINQL